MADLALANLAAHFAGQPLLSPVPECGAEQAGLPAPGNPGATQAPIIIR